MFLAPDGDEVEIADAAAQFLADAMPIARLHGEHAADMDEPLRRSLSGMGWFGLALPEAEGGSGLSAVEHVLFFREVGRQCGPMDVLAQCLAAMVAAAAGDVDLRAAIVAGDRGVALAVDDGDGLRILGSPQAEYALRVDRDGAQVVSLGGPADGAAGGDRPALDPANSMRLATGAPSGAVAQATGDHIWRMGQLGTAAMLVGVAEAALDLIVEYAKVRETFGRKIGTYQAVRHPCADMALRAEAARCQLWYAAAAVKEGRSDVGIHLDAAKHLANQAALANGDTNIQLHGGIGVTDEHDAHLLLKHAWTLSKLFGGKRALLGRLVGARVED